MSRSAVSSRGEISGWPKAVRVALTAGAIALCAAVLAGCARAQVTVTLQAADLAMIPGSQRQVYATVSGTPNLEVHWSASGGCTLTSVSTTAAPQTVQAPGRGGTCSLRGGAASDAEPSFRSAVSCRVTATSAADPTKTAAMNIPVCSPRVQLTVFPESTVLFTGQPAVIQSDLRGSINTGVTWTLTTNPGGAGSLSGGNSNRHAIFAATAPGTYVLTATSQSDPQKKASTTLRVTDHRLPAPRNDHTEAIDCVVAEPGARTYDVGPAWPLRTLSRVPWTGLKPGDAVRIHNDDTTGHNPTTYHEHVVLAQGGTASKPLRICGVPDAQGIKPILDGANADSPPGLDWAGGWVEDLGIIVIYDGPHKFEPGMPLQRNLLIEGLHLRNASKDFQFRRLKDGALVAYNRSAACIHVHTGLAVMLRGNELENCGQAIFANSQTPGGSVVTDLTVEGNYLHGWGGANNYLVHGMYLQALGLQVQFNFFGASAPAAIGNLLKSRSVMNFLRWNYMDESVAANARAFDLVEPQDFDCYIIPHSFAAYHTTSSGNCNTTHGGSSNDPMTADDVAANLEALHADYVYGNIMDDSGSESAFVHYGYDQQTAAGPAFHRRGGTLYYWNNTHLFRKGEGMKLIFDPQSPDQGHSYEFPITYSLNNVFAASGDAVMWWLKPLWATVIVDSNWMKPGDLLPNRDSADSYQGGVSAAERPHCGLYYRCAQGNGHMVWLRNGQGGSAAATLYQGVTPFDVNTFLPDEKMRGLAAHLPPAIRDQPSNMQYLPATNTIGFRQSPTSLGALN